MKAICQCFRYAICYSYASLTYPISLLNICKWGKCLMTHTHFHTDGRGCADSGRTREWEKYLWQVSEEVELRGCRRCCVLSFALSSQRWVKDFGRVSQLQTSQFPQRVRIPAGSQNSSWPVCAMPSPSVWCQGSGEKKENFEFLIDARQDESLPECDAFGWGVPKLHDVHGGGGV